MDAILEQGSIFNARIKNLANNATSYTYSSSDSKIQKIERSLTEPQA